jgi:hypothetical protein
MHQTEAFADEESAGNRSLGRKRQHSRVLLQIMAWGLERLTGALALRKPQIHSLLPHLNTHSSLTLWQAAEKPVRHSRTSTACTSGTRRELSRRMLKKVRLLTRPTLARRDAPCPRQGRSFATDPRFTFHASRFTISASC